MPSYAELQAEPWWSREIVTAELARLGDELCRRTGRPSDAWGDKGNNRHLNGGHRSQEWILNSDYCTNMSYTVQSGLTADQLRHIGAGDFTPGAWGTAANRALMVKHTGNLFTAAKAGRLTGLRQIFGTLNGTSAIGLNVVTGTTTYPDSSHLDHLHFTFDRKHMRDPALMARILEILTGDDMDTVLDHNTAWRLQEMLAGKEIIVVPPDKNVGAAGFTEPNRPQIQLNRLEAKVAALSVPQPAPVDPDTLKAVLLDPQVLAAIAKAVTDEIAS